MIKILSKILTIPLVISFSSGITSPLQAKVLNAEIEAPVFESSQEMKMSNDDLDTIIHDLSVMYYRHAELDTQELRDEAQKQVTENLNEVAIRMKSAKSEQERAYLQKLNRQLNKQLQKVGRLSKEEILNSESEVVHGLIKIRNLEKEGAKTSSLMSKQIGKRLAVTFASIFIMLCFVSVVLMPVTFKYLDCIMKEGEKLGPIPSN